MLKIQKVGVDELKPYIGNAKMHSSDQIDQIAESMTDFGNCDPIAAWHNESGEIEVVEGHGRLMALKRLGIREAPVIFLDHLTDEQRRAYAIVHNKLTMNTGFDIEILNSELESIESIDMSKYDLSISIDGTDVGDSEPNAIDFKMYDEEIETSYTCEKCGFEW